MSLPVFTSEKERRDYWEDHYGLPRGVIEAIQTCPSPARIAEVIGQVRDRAIGETIAETFAAITDAP